MAERTERLCYDTPRTIEGHVFEFNGISHSEGWVVIWIDNVRHNISLNSWYTVDSNLDIHVPGIDVFDSSCGIISSAIDITVKTSNSIEHHNVCLNNVCKQVTGAGTNDCSPVGVSCDGNGNGNGNGGNGNGDGNISIYGYLIIGFVIMIIAVLFYLWRKG